MEQNLEVISISGGRSEDSVAREVVEAIWRANGAFCEVCVDLRDLDSDSPSYLWDETSFDEWQKENKDEE